MIMKGIHQSEMYPRFAARGTQRRLIQRLSRAIDTALVTEA